MRRQRSMSQIKEDKITARELNEMEVNNMPDREFKVTVIKILTGHEKRVENLNETFKKDRNHQKVPMRDEELSN